MQIVVHEIFVALKVATQVINAAVRNSVTLVVHADNSVSMLVKRMEPRALVFVTRCSNLLSRVILKAYVVAVPVARED